MNFNSIVDQYKLSSKWNNLSKDSQTAYRKPLERLLEIAGVVEREVTGDENAMQTCVAPMQNHVAQSRSLEDFWNASIRSLGISNSEKNKLFALLNVVYKAVGLTPMGFQTLPHSLKESNPWTKEEVDTLWNANLPAELKTAVAFLRFCRGTGMRPWVEARELKWSNVGERIEVVGSKRKEAGKVSRKIKVLPEVAECLALAKLSNPKPVFGEYVWITERGTRVQKDTIRNHIMRACSLTGIPFREMYDARRGLVTSLLRSGVDIYAVKDIMGHSDIKSTMRYDKRTLDERADALVSV